MSDPWRCEADGLQITVRLTPKSAKDKIEGLGEQSDGRKIVLARVRAVPEKGAANKALEALFAKALKTPKSSVNVEAGTTARIKALKIQGNAEALAEKLEELLKA